MAVFRFPTAMAWMMALRTSISLFFCDAVIQLSSTISKFFTLVPSRIQYGCGRSHFKETAREKEKTPKLKFNAAIVPFRHPVHEICKVLITLTIKMFNKIALSGKPKNLLDSHIEVLSNPDPALPTLIRFSNPICVHFSHLICHTSCRYLHYSYRCFVSLLPETLAAAAAG